jgi:hypothetical protein
MYPQRLLAPENSIPGNDSLAECLGQASRLWAWRVCFGAWEVYAHLRRPLQLTPMPSASQGVVCRSLPSAQFREALRPTELSKQKSPKQGAGGIANIGFAGLMVKARMFQGVSTHHVGPLAARGTRARGSVDLQSYGCSRIILRSVANHIPRDKVHRPLRQR